MKELIEIRRLNLKDLVDQYGSQVGLANALDESSARINHLLTGQRNIGEKTARKYENQLNKPIYWLDINHKIESTSPLLQLDDNVVAGPENRGNVPVISWVQAGVWCEAIDNYETGDAERWIPCPVAHSKHTYALRVRGDSMVAANGSSISFPEGTLIYIDPERPIISGKKVIAKLLDSNEVTFKVYREEAGKKWLIPLNPQYDKIELVAGMHICGVVIFMGSDV
jgi:SOS-response transcriptional repressor LexA